MEKVEEEFGVAWEVLSRKWLIHVARAKSQKKSYTQLEDLSDFAAKQSSEFPNTCLLISIMIATPSNSSLIERAYSILEIICAKRRNRLTAEHIECLFLLATLKLGLWDVEDYLGCLKFLEEQLTIYDKQCMMHGDICG